MLSWALAVTPARHVELTTVSTQLFFLMLSPWFNPSPAGQGRHRLETQRLLDWFTFEKSLIRIESIHSTNAHRAQLQSRSYIDEFLSHPNISSVSVPQRGPLQHHGDRRQG